MIDGVFIIGIGMIRFKKYPEKTVKQMTAEAIEDLLKDIQVNLKEIEAVWFSNSTWGASNEQHCIRGQVALIPLGIEGIPITNVENACAGGATALHEAWMGIKAGLYDLVLAVGAEKLWLPDNKEKMIKGFISGTDVEISGPILEAFQADAAKKVKEVGGEEKLKIGGHSAFMDIYGMSARMHMKQYGTTQKQLAYIAAKNHFHGSLNPMAQYQINMNVEDVLQDHIVSYPLTRSMCAPIGDGSAAVLLCSERALRKFPSARPVKILASLLASGTQEGGVFDPIAQRISKNGYEKAGLGPQDIDVAEVHDATAFGELKQYEELGFCPEGQGGAFAESGATKLGGEMPVNTSGGLECRGHPIGASGLAQVYELVKQLRGEADDRQVEGARTALALNGGGFIGLGEAAMCVHILGK